MPGDEHRGAAGSVLGLRQQVGGDQRRIGGVVGDDDDLGGAGGIASNLPLDGPLGQRDVGVAGTDDHVDRSDGVGPVGERGDRLRATDPVDVVDAGERRGGERGVGDRPVAARRDAQRDLADPGDPGRDGGHEHRAGVGGAAAGDVAARPVDGDDDLAGPDAVAIEVDGPGDLGLVVGADLTGGVLERVADVAGQARQRRVACRRRDPQVLDGAAVEAGGELPDRDVAPAADVGDDRVHRVLRSGGVVGCGQHGREVPGERAEVKQVEHGGVHRNRGVSRNRLLCQPSGEATGWRAMSASELPELSTLRALLDELTVRLVNVAERYDETPDSAVAADLFAAERALLGAGRALDRAISRLTP